MNANPDTNKSDEAPVSSIQENNTPERSLPEEIDDEGLKAYCDPVIFGDDRVLRTLLRKECHYVPTREDYFQGGWQSDVGPVNRRDVVSWMWDVCEDLRSPPEVFCLAINYLDRFLSLCAISRPQLQLLGAVCLLVSWKVREHRPLPASRLVEYSDFNFTLLDLTEWEVLLLSKLDWDVSSVIASDFVEHVLRRIRVLRPEMDVEVLRREAESLIALCSIHYAFSSLPPSLVGVASVLSTFKTSLNTPYPEKEMSRALNLVEKVTGIHPETVRDCMTKIEEACLSDRDSLPSGVLTPPSSSPMKEQDKSVE